MSKKPDKKSTVGGHDARRNQFATPVPFITMVLPPNYGREVAIVFPPPATAFGLDVLKDVDKIYIHPVDKLPFKAVMPLSHKYKILNGSSQFLLAAAEAVDCGSKWWRGMQRRYCIYFFSAQGDLLFTSERLRLPCCSRKEPKQEAVSSTVSNVTLADLRLTKIRVCSGQQIGVLRDVSSPLTGHLCVDDANGENVYKISGRPGGNFCPPLAAQNSSFKLFDVHQGAVGDFHRSLNIRDSSGQQVECIGASFPRALTPVSKALILSAAFELNISYFKRQCSCDFCVYAVIYIWIFALIGAILIFALWISNTIKF